MAVTYTWNGYLDTGMIDAETGPVLTQVYTCSVCFVNVSDTQRPDHTEYHNEPPPPEPEPDPEPPTP